MEWANEVPGSHTVNLFCMAHYFEIGILCSLPETIDNPFAQNSRSLLYCLAIPVFRGYGF